MNSKHWYDEVMVFRIEFQARRAVATGSLLLALASETAFAAFGPQVAHVGSQRPERAPLPLNAIVVENALPGNPPSEWDIVDEGSASIQGYASEISVARGGTVEFKIKTDSTDYRLDVYRMGFYGGMGARRITTLAPSVPLPQVQPDCVADSEVGLVDCGTWSVSATWDTPVDAVSGIYFAKLVRQDPPHAGAASHVYFVVRDDDGHSDLLFQTSDETWQAYNSYGGASLYKDFHFGLPAGRGFKVSYNRPFNTRRDIAGLGKRSFLFNAEYPMVRWLEANGYDVSYATGVDTARYNHLLSSHKVFLSVGHDEYWSGSQRCNVEAARDEGVNLAFFSGNSCFWKTRWEASIDGSDEPYKTLVCYKETHADSKIDPDSAWTGSWRDPRFSPPSDGGRPENGLKGTQFTVNGIRHDSITISAADGKLRFWRGTAVASLPPAAKAVMPEDTLGHEWDCDIDNGARPTGLFRMSTTSMPITNKFLLDYGSLFGSDVAVHSLTMYRHASGALVFCAGTIQWSWGLDSEHDRGPSMTDLSMRQATVNLLADMGAQPQSLQAGLFAAAPSIDFAPPSATIDSPADGETVLACDTVTIQGAAWDAGGGVVAGVEISLDGGVSWHPASGRATWSYVLRPGPSGVLDLCVRAVDDSGNIGLATSHVMLNRVEDPSSPLSIFGWSGHPLADSRHDGKHDYGVKFRSDVDGVVLGVRYYKGGGNNGTHIAKLWDCNGAVLASASFENESFSGWQEVLFRTPVPISAATTIVASVHCQASIAIDDGFFTRCGVDNGPLHALQSGVDGGNGVRSLLSSGFPATSMFDRNYWVDVLFLKSSASERKDDVVPSSR
jgi:hypothetical protein